MIDFPHGRDLARLLLLHQAIADRGRALESHVAGGGLEGRQVGGRRRRRRHGGPGRPRALQPASAAASIPTTLVEIGLIRSTVGSRNIVPTVTTTALLLEGVLVADFTRVLAGPLA